MARTDADLVKGALVGGGDYNTLSNPSLTRYIAVAAFMTDRLVTCAAAKDVTFSDDELTEIETWIAAWAYKNSDQQFASKTTAGASASFKGESGKRLESNHYGQTALMLDPSGCLQAMSNAARAGGNWLGKRKSEQIDYEDRD